jgi:hypothetical protein
VRSGLPLPPAKVQSMLTRLLAGAVLLSGKPLLAGHPIKGIVSVFTKYRSSLFGESGSGFFMTNFKTLNFYVFSLFRGPTEPIDAGNGYKLGFTSKIF